MMEPFCDADDWLTIDRRFHKICRIRALENGKENTLNRRFWKTAAAAVAAVALLLFAAAPRVQADERDKCRHAIEKAEANLDKAIRDHGEHSRQAEDRRRDLNAERERCWNKYRQWWNGKEHRWETEHDWDHEHH